MKKLTFLVIGLLVLFAPSGSRAQNFWEPVDGAPIGEAIALTIANNGNIVAITNVAAYTNVAPSLGNVFISSDNGKTWNESSQNLGTNVVSILKSPNGHLFTENETGYFYNYVYRSIDNGYTWDQIAAPWGVGSALAIDSSGNILLNNARQDSTPANNLQGWNVVNEGGVFVSTDEGLSWHLSQTSYGTFIDNILVDTRGNIFAIARSIIFQSTDETMWTSIQNKNFGVYNDYPGVYGTYPGIYGVYPSGSLFALDSGSDIFRLQDTVWIKTPAHFPDSTIIASITFDTKGNLYAITQVQSTYSREIQLNKLLRSSDSGLTWLPIDSGVSCIGFSPIPLANRIIEGAIGSICVSTDVGSHWSTISHGIGNSEVDNIATLANGTIFVQAGGLYHTTDNGETWSHNPATVGDFGDPGSLKTTGDYIFVQDDNRDFFRSSDEGVTWDTINNGLPLADSIGYFLYGGVFPDQCGHLFCYANWYSPNPQLYYSSDYGNSWKRSSTSRYISGEFVSNSMCEVLTGGIDTIYKSLDGGDSWQSVGVIPNDSSGISDLMIDSKDNIFATTWSERIFRSTDDGASWQYLWRYDSAENQTFLLADSQGDIYLGSGLRIFRSKDEGLTWNPLDSVLGGTVIVAMVLSKDGYIYYGTHDDGIFRSVNSTLDVVQSSPVQLSLVGLSQNSPNPFTQSTSISFTLNEPSFITLKLFNPLGSEVAALANGFFDAGEHEVTFDRGDLPDGVYFYRLEANGQSVTRSFVVLR